MIRRLLLISLAFCTPALLGNVACSKHDCEDTGSCGEYDGPLPWCDGVFRHDDGTICDTCPVRGDDGIWRWPDGHHWDPSEASEILCDDGGTGGSSGAGGSGGTGGGTGGAGGSGPIYPDAIFVAPDGAASSTGAPTDPLGSITDAIDAAEAAGLSQVVLCDGTYYEHVVISAPITLVGGYDCSGPSPVPDETARPVVAPTDPGYALLVDNVDGAVVIEGLQFQAADATDVGGSSIAAFVRNSSDVTFRNVALLAGNGADGEAGTVEPYTFGVPQNGHEGTPIAGGGFVECPCPDGSTSSGGLGGAPAPTGQPGGPGGPDLGGGAGGTIAECQTNTGGHSGTRGPDGDDGQGAQTHGTLAEGGWTPGPGADGSNGTPGQGGGGGASTNTTGGGGGGGCGGCAGAGAAAGTGGGSSIALLVFDSTVTVESSQLVTGDGGSGGDAARGQQGQQEFGAGGTPQGFACMGGRGAPGGDGGASGGGAGGLSVGVLYAGMAPNVGVTTGFTLGDAGPGGAGVAGVPSTAGIDGVQAEMLQAE